MVAAEQTQNDLYAKLDVLIRAGCHADLVVSGVSALEFICLRPMVEPSLRKCVQLLLSRLEQPIKSELAARALVQLCTNFSKAPVWKDVFNDLLSCIKTGRRKSSSVPKPTSAAKGLALWALSGERDTESVMATLISEGADPNVQFKHHSALSHAYISNNIPGVALLLKHGADPTRSEIVIGSRATTSTLTRAFFAATRNLAHLDEVARFAAYCPDPLPADCVASCFLELCHAPRFLPSELLALFLGPPFNVDPKAHRDQFGDTLLHTAISCGNSLMVADLVGRPLVLSSLWNVENCDGRTPLSLVLHLESAFAFPVFCGPTLERLVEAAEDEGILEFLDIATQLARELLCPKSLTLLEGLQNTNGRRVRGKKRVRCCFSILPTLSNSFAQQQRTATPSKSPKNMRRKK